MPNNILLKSFNLFFSKFKCLPTVTFSPDPPTIDEADLQGHIFPATTPTIDADALPFKNFNSPYDDSNSDANSATSSTSASPDFDAATDSLPDFTSAVASHRFFFSSPGSSNSIFEQPLEAPPPPQLREYSGEVMSGGVAVLRYSRDPYADFRESMEEMMEAREVQTGFEAVDNWEFLHELLLCYLTLNPSHVHEFIICAFVDVIISDVLP